MVKTASLLCAFALASSALASSDTSRIVGGNHAPRGKYPFMATVQWEEPPRHKCGGTLVAPRVILTTALCANFGRRLKVRLNTTDSNGAGNPQHEEIYATGVVRHPDYDINTGDYDVGVIILEKASSFTPATLATSSARPGAMTTMLGWGMQKEGGNKQWELSEVDTPARSRSECTAAYPQFALRNMMCVGLENGGKGACKFDQGGE